MTKYATLKQYQPYIDVIMADLGLTGKVNIVWEFGSWRTMGGDAILYAPMANGERYGRIRMEKTAPKQWTIKSIMHELKHIQQYYEGRLGRAYPETKITKRGTPKIVWKTKWMDQAFEFYGVSKNPRIQTKYLNQPWEVEAYAYQEEIDRLFPKLELPKQKLYIGAINKTKFYKMKG